jgi:hypothetical protein
MNEVDLVTRLRADLPDLALDGARTRLDAELGVARPDALTGHRRQQDRASRPQERASRPRRRLAFAAGSAAAVLAAGAVTGVALSSHGNSGHPSPAGQHHQGPPVATQAGPPATGAELVAYATRAAAAAPLFRPGPHEWIYTKVVQAASSAGNGGYLMGAPNERQTVATWTRVDGRQTATIVRGKLVVSPVDRNGPVALPVGWRSVSYRYLDSLPASPAKLRAIISADLGSDSSAGIFTAIQALMTNVVLPPRLRAELYSLLISLPGVQFDANAKDLVGRSGVGLRIMQNSYVRDEMVIDPTTYAYLGQEYVAVHAHDATGLDGSQHLRKGQVLGWSALLQSGIVRQAGQVPAS